MKLWCKNADKCQCCVWSQLFGLWLFLFTAVLQTQLERHRDSCFIAFIFFLLLHNFAVLALNHQASCNTAPLWSVFGLSGCVFKTRAVDTALLVLLVQIGVYCLFKRVSLTLAKVCEQCMVGIVEVWVLAEGLREKSLAFTIAKKKTSR